MKKQVVVVVRAFMPEEQILQQFAAIHQLVAIELQQAEKLIRNSLQSNIALVNQIGEHIIQSGGKRLRMILVLLSAKAFGYQGFAHIQLAAIIEMLHTATLLHDDVVDASELRRGQPTANKIWGEHASVLVGDYLYSRSFQLMVQVNDMSVLEILAKASNTMAEGEVQQLINCHNPDITEENYMQVIHQKTGTLFAAAAQMGPILTKNNHETLQAMLSFGTYLGAAFQLIDDVLDYNSSAEQIGKNIGDDLAEGKPTLPVLRALQQLDNDKADILRSAIRYGKTENVQTIIQMIKSTDAITYTYKVAQQQAQMAHHCLEIIPASQYRDALTALVEFAIARRF
jgi:octaprenyl-diphosphate synthase